ncbi:MAG: hypothetical protein IJC86_01215 [Clostridia bacterium]|nr:hypothetical protein [Clostridia bacterium]
MFRKKSKFIGVNIPHSCDYCQNCVVEGGKNFCRYKKSINKKGKCSKFDYNPVMRKVAAPQVLEKYDESDFSL